MAQLPTGSVSHGPVGPRNPLATTGLILGISSVTLLCILPLWLIYAILGNRLPAAVHPAAGVPMFLSVPVAILGLIFSAIGLRRAKARRTGAGSAKVGMLLSILALVASILFIARMYSAQREMREWTEKLWDDIRHDRIPPKTR
jgi:hypothetical protein